MDKLKVFWPHPEVRFKGAGISEYWAEAMRGVGMEPTSDYVASDMVFFISDSQLHHL